MGVIASSAVAQAGAQAAGRMSGAIAGSPQTAGVCARGRMEQPDFHRRPGGSGKARCPAEILKFERKAARYGISNGPPVGYADDGRGEQKQRLPSQRVSLRDALPKMRLAQRELFIVSFRASH
jgi:hypothetical protein